MKRKEREKTLADDATENDLTLASTALQMPKPLVRQRARGRGYKTKRVGHGKCERRSLRIRAGGGEAGERQERGCEAAVLCAFHLTNILRWQVQREAGFEPYAHLYDDHEGSLETARSSTKKWLDTQVFPAPRQGGSARAPFSRTIQGGMLGAGPPAWAHTYTAHARTHKHIHTHNNACTYTSILPKRLPR